MSIQNESLVSEKEIKKRTIRSFIVFFLLIAVAVVAWKWVNRQPENNGASSPIRSVLNMNESIFRNALFSESNLSKPYTKADAVSKVRVNGRYGMSDGFDAASWRLKVLKNNGDTLSITLDDLKALPKTEVIFDFKCIEGWSQVTHWAGVRFSDFIKYYHLTAEAALQYSALITPDKEYYVGIDQRSMLQPQTILCYEMNGRPLPMDQGYPLRLIIPVKYGIKHLKRIGTISFSNQRPPDYWYERGYDYYAGL